MSSLRLMTRDVAFVVTAVALATAPLNSLVANDKDRLTDARITDRIEDELMFDHGVSSWQVDVNTADGIVKLSGTVDNILAKERAAKIVETIKGVRSVINQIKVAPLWSLTEEQIQNDVEAALISDPAADSYEIITKANGTIVTLTGTVDSHQEKDLAGAVAKGVRGVSDVNNDIIVEHKTDRGNGEIRHEIEQALRWSVLVDHALINVGVEDGDVTLSGTVGSAAERREARYASWVAGVKTIDDSALKVEDWARDEHRRKNKYVTKSAEEIRDAIKDALLYDPRVKSFNVDVEAYGSTVTLRGTVDNLAAKRSAEQVARNTVGVSSVFNRMKVRPAGTSSDAQLMKNIKNALLRDPYVDRFEITVSVHGGVASLHGTVDSFFEKSQAEFVAGGVAGVFDVRNRLTVDYKRSWVYDPYVDHAHAWYSHPSPVRSTDKSDDEIKDAIDDELWWSPFVDADEVTVSVDNGIATLTGIVDSASERSTATENAWEGGAIGVVNKLEVE